MGVDDEMPGQDATRPDSEERHEVEPVTAVCQIEQAVYRNDKARKRGKDERVALLDSNLDLSGSQEDADVVLPQDDVDPGLDEGRGDHEIRMNVSETAPPGGETAVAPPVALYSSYTSQPASQHASLRMTSKIHSNQVSNNVTPGTNAGAEPSKGGGREERVGAQAIPDDCVHTKDGTCTLHGPGAKWRWRPILPVSRRPIGPDGKVKKREYFWKCEVGGGGRNLQQSRICFMKKPDGGNNDTMGYQM